MPPEYQDVTVVNEKTPVIICSWIMTRCGTVSEKTGKTPFSYSLARTMRSAISFVYITEYGCENSSFARIEGKWVGNPTKTTMVERYMKSLRRLKVGGPMLVITKRCLTYAR